MMSFGTSGAAVADEQASSGGRKYNVSEKLHILDDGVIYGGSGNAGFILEVYEGIKRNLRSQDENSPRELHNIYETTINELLNHKTNKKSEYLYANTGLTLEEVQSGTLRSGQKIDEAAKSNAIACIGTSDNLLDTSILLGGIEDGRFNIYCLETRFGGSMSPIPYQSIGSGSDESNKSLSNFFSELPRERRSSICPKEGLLSLIEATNAASKINHGVGGTLSITYMDKSGIITLSEDRCVLAAEVVKAYSAGFLSKDFTHEAVGRLVIENGDVMDISDKMFENSGSEKKLNMFLRGYKIGPTKTN